MKDTEYIKEVAKTILAQLGGNKFSIVTGSKNFSYGEDENGRPFLRFSLCRDLKDFIPNAKIVPNRCTIYLNEGTDDYDMVFERATNGKCTFNKKTCEMEINQPKVTVTSEHKHIYCDQLQEIFEHDTNLLLDMCRVRFS